MLLVDQQHKIRHMVCNNNELNRKIKEFKHEMKRYKWHLIGLWKVRWKNIGGRQTALCYIGEENRHVNDIGFLVKKAIKNTVLDCQPAGSTSDYEKEDIKDSFKKLQEVIDKVGRKNILIIHG